MKEFSSFIKFPYSGITINFRSVSKPSIGTSHQQHFLGVVSLPVWLLSKGQQGYVTFLFSWSLLICRLHLFCFVVVLVRKKKYYSWSFPALQVGAQVVKGRFIIQYSQFHNFIDFHMCGIFLGSVIFWETVVVINRHVALSILMRVLMC